ncbi:MAG TPA: flagellar export protein FliJ [Alphaproteobacteria bacterium]|nr:flagellar export protein FliJ [Alphaproteobacteria bacterium]HAJ48070.1 flagellar export protein FliJ [Alphaproteobacteria bacterium]
MRSRDVLVRLHKFKVDDVQRRLKSLQDMRADLGRKTQDLEVMMQDEQRRASNSDLGRLAYPTFVRSVIARRENIQRSIDEVERQIATVQEELEAAFRDLKKHEIEAGNAALRERAQEERRAQSVADEGALTQHVHKAADAGV